MINNIIDQLKRDEGFRANVYTDTVGKRTVGYGHNLDAKPLSFAPPMSEETASEVLADDVNDITNTLVHLLPWTDAVHDAHFGVLQNMAFNMGVEGLVGFHHMLSYMQRGQFVAAAQEMESSKWYNEVGDRAKRLVKQMEAGLWQ